MVFSPRQSQHQDQKSLPQVGAPLSDEIFRDIQFSRTDDKNLNPELFNGIARRMAQLIAKKEDGKNRPENNPTQLRRFYDEVVLWEMRASQQPEKFAEFLPFIRMLNAKAAYAEGRKLVDRTFVELLAETLKQVNNTATLTTCKTFWEAFMGFYKQERQD